MSKEIKTNTHFRIPLEIWTLIGKFADLPTLYNMIKAEPYYSVSLSDVFISRVKKALKVSHPDIDTDTKVSIERLIELPFMQELLNSDEINEATFLNHIKEGVSNTLSIWGFCNFRIGRDDVVSNITHLLETDNIDLEGTLGNHKNTLLYSMTQKYSSNDRGVSPFAQDGVQVIQKLIDAGADINAKNVSGITVLHLVAGFLSNMVEKEGYKGDPTIMLTTLIKNGADLNAITTKDAAWGNFPLNSTPLHVAMKMSTADQLSTSHNVEILLDNGANPLLSDAKGFTPFSIFQKNWLEEGRDDKSYSAQIYEKACNAIIVIDELIEPQQVWEAYDNAVQEYVVSGDISIIT